MGAALRWLDTNWDALAAALDRCGSGTPKAAGALTGGTPLARLLRAGIARLP